MDSWVFVNVLLTAVAFILAMGWAIVTVVPIGAAALLSLVFAGGGMLSAFYRSLSSLPALDRVHVFAVGRRNERFGPRLERELAERLERSLPGARACACIESEGSADDTGRGGGAGRVATVIRIWKDDRSRVIPTNSIDKAAAVKQIASVLQHADGDGAWQAKSEECASCNAVKCPMHWRHVA